MTLVERLRAAFAGRLQVGGEDEGDWAAADAPREAAVLVAITDRPAPGVILTQRPQWLRSHAGQVAFPGGKIDATDRDAIDAALREAEEEIGLSPRDVTVIGATEAYRSGSGYRITPVIAVIPPDIVFDPNPDEVEDWFEVPLDLLFHPESFVQAEAHWQGRNRRYYELMWQDRRIWGATAGIIVNLARSFPKDWRA